MGIIPCYKEAKDYVGRKDFKGKNLLLSVSS